MYKEIKNDHLDHWNESKIRILRTFMGSKFTNSNPFPEGMHVQQSKYSGEKTQDAQKVKSNITQYIFLLDLIKDWTDPEMLRFTWGKVSLGEQLG